MKFFTKYKAKPTAPERAVMLEALRNLYEQLDLVDPDITKDWIKVAQLNESVTNQSYDYKDKFGKEEYAAVEKEAYYLDTLRRGEVATR